MDATMARLNAQFEATAAQLQASLEQLAVRHDAHHEARLQQMDATMARLNAQFEATAAQLQAVYASSSWRLSAPIRLAGGQWRRLREQGLRGRLKVVIRRCAHVLIRIAAPIIVARPWLRSMVLCVLNIIPGLKKRLRRMMVGLVSQPIESVNGVVPNDFTDLSAQAQRVYNDLKAAVDMARQEEH
jgi:O-antigen chain-terminating methyltransferase